MRRALLLLIAWSLCCGCLLAAEPEVVFKDEFKGKLDKGWKWLPEEPKKGRGKLSDLDRFSEMGDTSHVYVTFKVVFPGRCKAWKPPRRGSPIRVI